MNDHETLPYSLAPLPDDEAIARARALADTLRERRTCRWFSDAPVPRAVIEAAIEAAGSAPSGANHQPWHFTVIGSPDIKRKIRAAAEAEERRFYGADGDDPKASAEWLTALADLGTDADKPFLETAPWLIAIFYERFGLDASGEKEKRYYPHESVGIACGLLIAALHDAGLATLTHTPSPMGFLNELLGRPKNEMPYLLLVVGHPAPGCRVPDIQRLPLAAYAGFIE